ncbi:MAG: hypothetical protein HY614_07075 [Candidatus Rokubacteria bacterium]|nr:hypothetical protein [Candidatus Rokubacteria bacterium]
MLGVFFYPVLFGKRLLIPADILLSHPPWNAMQPFEPQNGLLSDQIEEFYPDRHLARESIWSGSLPLWNPFAAGGRPLLGNGGSAVFYPLNVLSYILPLATSFAWIAVVKLFIAGMGMYLFLRDLGRSRAAALLGGCAFMLSGFMIVWLNHTHTNHAVWLPSLFLLGGRFADCPDRRRTALLAVAIGIQLFGGHAETAAHMLAATLAYVVFMGMTSNRAATIGAGVGKLAGLFTCAVGLGALLAAVQLLPHLEYLLQSVALANRMGAPLPLLSLSLPRFLEMPLLAFPYLYGTPVKPRTDFASVVGVRNFNEVSGGYVGIVVLVLAIAAVAYLWREPSVRFFALLGGISWAVACDVPIVSNIVNSIPPFTMIKNQRLLLLVAFSLSCLGAFGLDWVCENARHRKVLDRISMLCFLATLMTCAAVIIAVLAIEANRELILEYGRSRLLALHAARPMPERLPSLEHWLHMLPRIFANVVGAARSPLISAAVALVLAVMLQLSAREVASRRTLAAGCILLALADLWMFGHSYNPMVERATMFPSTPALEFLKRDAHPFRVLGIDKTLLENTATVYRIPDVRGDDAVNVARYSELLDWAGSRPMHNLLDPSTYPDYESRIVDALNVKYVLSPVSIHSAKLRAVYTGEITIYQNLHALPRAYAVFRVRSSEGPEMTRRLLALGDVDLSREVILEGTSVLNLPAASSPTGDVTILTYGPGGVRLRARMTDPGVVVLNDTYFPGWVATVAGASAAIHRANHALRAVAVPAGVHDIEFTYKPLSVRLGAGLSLAAALGVVVLAVRRSAPPSGK